MNGIIISALNRNIDIFYISNTSPITWSCDIKDAKIFESYLNAKNELEDNFISLSATIIYTDIISVIISEFVDGVEIRRDKFL